MAQPTGVYVTFSSRGLREDLENVIYDISPTDTPFMSMGSRSDAIAVNHEWQTDALAAAADNFNEEGATLTAAEPTATTRVGNICQISLKTTLVRLMRFQKLDARKSLPIKCPSVLKNSSATWNVQWLASM